MNSLSPALDPESTAGSCHRVRDADGTRERLLQAARQRFARDGYSGTTVRDIATDAGVNVALINRYFTSKVGLFEACLRRIVRSLDETSTPTTLEELVEAMVRRLVDISGAEFPLDLMLLLRSSGDEGADTIRRDILRSYAEEIALIAGGRPTDGPDDPLLLRAEVVLAATLGVVLVRSSTGLEPLTSATASTLAEPVRLVVQTLL